VGAEDGTEPYWREYERHAAPLTWTRREPVLVIGREDLLPHPEGGLEPAREADVAEVTANSAAQHREDLRDDRYAADPVGFTDRHRKDVRDGRWWVARERGRIAFQVHVGASNAYAVQLGGVFVPEWARGTGHATRGVRAITALALSRHPRVSLYCDENNLAARRVYERVGFRAQYHTRSYLLNEPLGAD
jgi:hypothetical protein